MADWYPVLLSVKDRLCVVIGGGAVAERKTGGLLEAGAKVRIVSPELTPALAGLAERRLVEWRAKKAEEADLTGAFLLFAASGDPAANRRLAAFAQTRGILANLADEGESGDFLLPAVLRRGKLVIAASASGAGPFLASRVIRELEGRFGEEYAGYTEILGRIRSAVKKFVDDPAERRRLLAAVSDERVLREWQDAGMARETEERLLIRLNELAAAAACQDEDTK